MVYKMFVCYLVVPNTKLNICIDLIFLLYSISIVVCYFIGLPVSVSVCLLVMNPVWSSFTSRLFF
jgi:hypothetical protein